MFGRLDRHIRICVGYDSQAAGEKEPEVVAVSDDEDDEDYEAGAQRARKRRRTSNSALSGTSGSNPSAAAQEEKQPQQQTGLRSGATGASSSSSSSSSGGRGAAGGPVGSGGGSGGNGANGSNGSEVNSWLHTSGGAVCADLPSEYQRMPRMWRHCPVAAQSMFCQYAGHYCQSFAAAMKANDREKAAEALTGFMSMPRRCLLRPRGGRSKQKGEVSRLKQRIATAAADMSPSQSFTSAIRPGRVVTDSQANASDSSDAVNESTNAAHAESMRAVRRAEEIATSGEPHSAKRAVKALYGGAEPVDGPGAIRRIDQLHPAPKKDVRAIPAPVATLSSFVVVDDKLVVNTVRRIANGSAPGPSGWTGELLRTVSNDDTCLPGLIAIVQALANGWFGIETAPRPLRALLLACRLVALSKDKKKAPDGSAAAAVPVAADAPMNVRPIAMGESLWKLVVLCALEKLRGRMHNLFPSIQFGVGRGGGSESALLAIQSALDANPEHVAIFTDVTNAFNTRERADIAQILYANPMTCSLWSVFGFSYGSGASPLLMYGSKGRISHAQASATGVRQGDPLASFLFALSMQKIYFSVCSMHRQNTGKGKARRAMCEFIKT